MADSTFPGISGAELVTFSNIITKKVTAYFQDDSHRRDFEKWYEGKYGKPYVWKD